MENASAAYTYFSNSIYDAIWCLCQTAVRKVFILEQCLICKHFICMFETENLSILFNSNYVGPETTTYQDVT